MAWALGYGDIEASRVIRSIAGSQE